MDAGRKWETVSIVQQYSTFFINNCIAGKFHGGSVFADGQSLPMHGVNFHERAHTRTV